MSSNRGLRSEPTGDSSEYRDGTRRHSMSNAERDTSGSDKEFIDDGPFRPEKATTDIPLQSFPNGYDVDVDITDARRTPDVNVYQQKKTLAQGMMDLALLSANANQLRYVLEVGNRHPYFYVDLTFISISIIFQIAVGVGLILNSRYNVKKHEDMCKANSFNNFTVIGIFIVTIVNVFISAFGIGLADVRPSPEGN